MNRSQIIRVLLLSGAGLLLLSMLAYPFGYDQAAFTVVGEMAIKHGAVTYRDFLDTKPPMIFVIYGVSSLIFGHHEWSIRAFDILYHIVSLFFLYRILRQTLSDERIAFGSVILYTLLYTTSGFWMTAQAETFALLPSILLFSLTDSALKGKTPLRNGLLAALCGIILFLLKFTLLIIPAGAVIYVAIYSNKENRSHTSKYLLGLLIGLVVSMCFFLGYMSYTGALENFLASIKWLQEYSAINPLFASDTIINRYFKLFPIDLIVAFGLSPIVLAGIGWYSIRSSQGKNSSAYSHLCIQFALAMIAVLYERKFFPYQYSRGYWAFAPLCVAGIVVVLPKVKASIQSYRERALLPRLIGIGMIAFSFCVAIFYSTVPRIFSQPLHWSYLKLSGKDVAQSVQDNVKQYFYKEQIQVADSLKAILGANEQMFLWGNGVGLYFRAERYPTTICLTNTPLVSPWTPAIWKEGTLRLLRQAPPKIFITEFGDDREYITGDSLDSWQHLQQWSELKSFVETNYTERPTIGHFKIFERK